MSVRVIFIRFHNLSSSISHGWWLSICSLCSKARSDHAIALNYTSSLLLFCALLEEHLSEDVFFLAKRVIVFDVVVVRLVKHAVWIMVAVRVFVADAPDLTELYMRIGALDWVFLIGWCIWIVPWLTGAWPALLRKILASKQKHLLMEATYDGDLGLGLRLGLARGSCLRILLLRLRGRLCLWCWRNGGRRRLLRIRGLSHTLTWCCLAKLPCSTSRWNSRGWHHLLRALIVNRVI